MAEKTLEHNCSAYVDKNCRCTFCGKTCHSIVNDSNGSGTGFVRAWCTRCGKKEGYYDDTGTTLYSDFET